MLCVKNMITIDGSYGSGGGQIIRTAIGLSALTGQSCKIYNIRAKRGNPGLREQHLQSILAITKLCNAEIAGAKIGSSEIEFYPNPDKIGAKPKLDIEISTAGSVGLILQALLIAVRKYKKFEINISGGATWGKWAVPVEYLIYVLFPILSRIGYSVSVEIIQQGFYPKGGAKIKCKTLTTTEFKPIEILDKGEIRSIKGISIATLSLRKQNVADRQRDTAIKVISEFFHIVPHIDVKYVSAICPGSGIQLWVTTANSILGANSLGELGKKSEIVGAEAGKKLIEEHNSETVDSHCADQLLPYLVKGSKIQASKITDHCKTNAYIIEKFIPVKFNFDNKTITVRE